MVRTDGKKCPCGSFVFNDPAYSASKPQNYAYRKPRSLPKPLSNEQEAQKHHEKNDFNQTY